MSETVFGSRSDKTADRCGSGNRLIITADHKI